MSTDTYELTPGDSISMEAAQYQVLEALNRGPLSEHDLLDLMRAAIGGTATEYIVGRLANETDINELAEAGLIHVFDGQAVITAQGVELLAEARLRGVL